MKIATICSSCKATVVSFAVTVVEQDHLRLSLLYLCLKTKVTLLCVQVGLQTVVQLPVNQRHADSAQKLQVLVRADGPTLVLLVSALQVGCCFALLHQMTEAAANCNCSNLAHSQHQPLRLSMPAEPHKHLHKAFLHRLSRRLPTNKQARPTNVRP